MLLLLVRHALLVTQESGGEQDAAAFFNVSYCACHYVLKWPDMQ